MNSAEENYNIQKHLIAHAQYILNFLVSETSITFDISSLVGPSPQLRMFNIL